MKTIYRANSTTKRFASSDIVDDDYVLQANETFEDPSGKQEPAKLVGTSWQDATQEEHEAWVKAQQAALPIVDNKPTDQQKRDAQTQIQLAQLMQQNKEQATFNAKLTIDIAMLKKQVADNNKTEQQ